MKFLFFAVFALLALSMVLAMIKANGKAAVIEPGNGADYQVHPTVLSPAERSFLGVLEPVLPAGVRVLPKIRLADVFATRKGLAGGARQSAFNRISNKHVDFLLVRTGDLSPVAAIELDDASHRAPERHSRDAFVDDVFKRCRLPLLRLPAQSHYSRSELKEQLGRLLARDAA